MIDPARATRIAALILGAVTLVRFWMSGVLELIGDEAYYWLWSEELALGYFSKPPGVAWAIRFGTELLGDTERGVRFAAILCSALTGWGLYRLARETLDAEAGLIALAMALITPLFLAGSLLMTIDALSVCAWVWAANALWAIGKRPTVALRLWFATGAIAGAGLLAKPTLLALPFSIVLWAILAPERRRRLLGIGFWLMIATALLALVPPLWWNAQNEWVTFAHLRERGGLQEPWRFSLSSFLGFLGGQAAVGGPWLLIAFAGAVFSRRLRGQVPADARRFFLALWAPLFVFYAALALNKPGQPNWTAPSWIGALLFTIAAWRPLFCERPGWRRIAGASYALLLAAVIVLHGALLFWHFPEEGNRDPFERLRGHRDLARQVAVLRAETGAAFVLGSHYQTAALLTWYDPDRRRAYTLRQRPPRNQFDLWPSYRDRFPPGSDALFVARNRGAPPALYREFERVEELGPRRGLFRGRPERTYWIYRCHGLKEESHP